MSATHIIRVSTNCDVVTIARATALDRRLSFQARGMLLALLAMGDGAETSPDELVDASPAGRDAVYATLAELRTAGYVDRYPERTPAGKITRWVTFVHEVPTAEEPDLAEPYLAKPDMAPTSVIQSATRPYLAKPEVASAQPAKSPPTRDVFIPPPIPENQEDTDANASGRRRRHSAASAKPKAKWAAESKSVLDRIAVIQGFPVANWARQRLGVNTMLDAGYSPDEIVAAWQACIAEGWHAKRAVAVSAQTVNERIGPLKVAGKLAVGHAVGAVEWGL